MAFAVALAVGAALVSGTSLAAVGPVRFASALSCGAALVSAVALASPVALVSATALISAVALCVAGMPISGRGRPVTRGRQLDTRRGGHSRRYGRPLMQPGRCLDRNNRYEEHRWHGVAECCVAERCLAERAGSLHDALMLAAAGGAAGCPADQSSSTHGACDKPPWAAFRRRLASGPGSGVALPRAVPPTAAPARLDGRQWPLPRRRRHSPRCRSRYDSRRTAP